MNFYGNKKRETHSKKFAFSLNRVKDKDVIDWLDKQPNKSEYIKQLVRHKMGRNLKNT